MSNDFPGSVFSRKNSESMQTPYGPLSRKPSAQNLGYHQPHEAYGSRSASMSGAQVSPPHSCFADSEIPKELEERLQKEHDATEEAMRARQNQQLFESFMTANGSEDLAKCSSFHRYTIHVVDLETGRPSKKMTTTILDHVIPNLPFMQFPARSMPLGNRNLRITMDELAPVQTKGLLNRDNGVKIESLVMMIKMIEAPDDPHFEEYRDAYIQVPAGSRKKVTGDSRRFARFEYPSIFRVEASSLSDLQTPEELLAQLQKIMIPSKSANEQSSHFAVWVDHDEIDLGNIAQTLARAAKEGQVFEETQNTFIGQKLYSILQDNCPEVGHDMVMRSNHVFAGAKSEERGVTQKFGLQGKIVYHDERSPFLHWKPCLASFFRPSSVSDFLEKFFGSIASAGLPARLQKQATSLLADVQVTVYNPGAKDEKTHFIAGLGNSLLSNPQVVHKTFGAATVENLRFPGMPTVNIGTSANPVYCPAEYCKIVGEEQFLRNEPIFENASKTQRSYQPKRGDPFPNYKPSEQNFRPFKLVLANLGHAQNAPAVTHQMLSEFKTEIANRYDCKLKHAIDNAKMVSSTIDKFLDDGMTNALNDLIGVYPGIDIVLMTVVPDDISKDKIVQLRQMCDLLFGVQCCIVNGSEIVNRTHPLQKREMVMYTGEIVKKLFARAKVPPQSTDASKVTTVDGSGRVVGVHVAKFQDFRNFKKDFWDPETNKTDEQQIANATNSYMVNIVSASTKGKADVVTTTHSFVVKARDGLAGLASEISACVRFHTVGQGHNEPISIYLSGLRVPDPDFATLLQASIGRWLSQHKDVIKNAEASGRVHYEPKPKAKAPRRSDSGQSLIDNAVAMSHGPDVPESVPWAEPFNIACYVAEPRVSLSQDSAVKVTSSGAEVSPQAFQEFHTGVLAKTFKYSQTQSNTSQPMRVSYRSSWYKGATGQGDGDNVSVHGDIPEQRNGSLDTLETKPLPAILHLAQKASERSQLHVFIKPRNPEAQQPICPYGLRKIHSDLEGTFYFL